MSSSTTFTRALTRRHKRPEVSAPMPVREGQVRLASGTIKKSKISLPTELISTTNLLAYTAPDLPSHAKNPSKSKSASSSTASFRSGGDDSDMNTSIRSSPTPIASPGTTSSDVSPISLEYTQQTAYFDAIKRSNTTHSSTLSRSSTTSSNSTPPIPERALSHTTRSHQELARQRSRSKATPPSTSISNMHASRINQDQEYRRQAEVNPHPFGKELEQVNEVAEEFGAMMGDDEERILLSKGFFKFSAEDYLLEIQELHDSIFGTRPSPTLKTWI